MKKSNYSKIGFALFIAFLVVIISRPIYAQVGIGTTSPDASAVLDIQSSSNDKGILIPRMTQAQRNAISSPATGLMIFQTDGNVGFYFYDGSSWESFGEVKTVNGNSPAADGNVTLTFLATQTGTQAQRAATASPTDGLVHIVTGDPTPSENDKVYIYSTGLASWTLSSGFTDTDEQDISGSSFTVATSALLIDIEDGSGQTLDLSALEELVNDTDPATNLGGASQGDLAYDTTDDELQVYDGSSWVPVSSSVVTPTLDQVTDVGSSTTNGIDVGSLTVNSAFTLPTATGTAGQYLTVSTTTSELVFASPAAVVTPTLDQVTDVGSTTTNSIEVGGATVTGDLTVNTNTTLEGNTTIGDASSDDLTITARLDSDLIPKSDDSRSLGSSSLNFNTVNTLNVTSNAGMTVSSTAKLTLNTSATGTPTISLQQGGTEMAGIGSSTFFIGDSTSGNHYFFPQTGGSLGQVLAFTNTNTLELYSIDNLEQDTLDSVAKRGATTNEPLNINTMTVSTSINVMTNANLGTGTSTDTTVTIGDDSQDVLDIKADLRSNLSMDGDNLYDIGSLTKNVRNVFSRVLVSNSDLSLNVSNTADDDIFFQQSGITKAGVNSSTFYIGRDSNRYEFPQIAPATVNNQVLAYTATNSITFITIAGTTTPTLDQVTDVGSTTTNSIEVGGATVTGDLTVSVTTSLNGTTAIGDATSDDLTVTARLDSDLIPKTDNSRNIGSSSLNFDTVNTLNVTSNSAMTVSSTGILTLSTSATGTPTISLQQGGTEMAGIGSSTFFIGDSTSGNQYFFPQNTGIPGQVLTVSTTTSNLVFTSSGLLPAGSANGDIIHFSGTQWERTDELSVPFGGSGPILSNRSLDPRVDDTHDIGDASAIFSRGYFREINSGSGSVSLTFNTSATGTPTISFQQGGTEMAGIGSSTFFIGDSTSGNHYFFPSSTQTSTFSQVLTYDSSNVSNTLYWSDFVLISPGSNDGAVLKWNNTSQRWVENTDIKLDDSAYSDDITLGASIIPRASNLSLGRASDRFENVYTNAINSNTSSLTISTTATGTPTISFQQGGTELAGIGSSTFFIGDSTSGDHYFFPQETGTAGQVLTVSSTTNQLVFTTSDSLPIGTTTGTVLRYNPATSSWEETELLKVNPGGSFANNITVSNTLVPITNNTLDLGKTSYEFSKIFSRNLTTATPSLTFSIDGDNIYFKLKDVSAGYGSIFLTSQTAEQNQQGVTIIGADSYLTTATSSNYNTVFGFKNLTNTSLIGSYNVILGSKNLTSLTSGNGNIAIGDSAAASLATGDNIIAIGRQALNASIEADNIGIGNDALLNNTSGSANLAIGKSALSSNTLYDNNIALGNRALIDNSSSNNTAVGKDALDFENTGGNNTAIGYAADINNSSIANSTVIGANATVTTSNTIRLGDSNVTSLITSGTLTLDGVTYPNTTGTAGQVLTVSSTTSELVFTSIGALPSGTATGTTLRYNYGSSAWEETNVLAIAPGGALGSKIAIRQSLMPQVDNSYDLGHSSYEFADVNTRNISTSTSSISINIDGFSAELYEDTNVLTLKNVEKFETASSSLTFELSGKSMHLKTTANENYEFNNYPNVSTGSRNTSFGSSALRPSAASYSTAMGYGSLNASALSGNYNTAIGYYSGNANSTGEKNTSIGSEAARDNTTGSNNVTIGYRAAFDSADIGSNNVIIGSESLPTTSTVGDQNVVIGATAEVSASTNNSIAIGYGAVNSNSNSIQLGNSSITSVETSGVVSATGFETTGTATITTLTVGDSSKYTLPTTRGTAGQVLTVSTTTSQLVFASRNPYYLLAEANDGQSITSNDTNIEFPGASLDSNNGITIGSDGESFDLPAGKIYKCVGYIDIEAVNQHVNVITQFYDSGSAVGVQGISRINDATGFSYGINVPATLIIDATASSKNITFTVVSTDKSFNVEGPGSYVIIEEL